MSGRDKNYKHGRKNQWRNWTWKQIGKRVKDKKNARVLYLPGKKDLDRAVAVKHGFSPCNLFAVDKDISIVKKMRGKGVNAICGDFLQIAFADPTFFDVIHADLCCGFTDDVAMFVNRLIKFSSLDRVVLINLQRGRDKDVKSLKKFLETDIKERNRLIFTYFALRYVIFLDEVSSQVKNCSIINCMDDMKRNVRYMTNICCPDHRSYKGNKVTMDSVIFNVPTSFLGDYWKQSLDLYDDIKRNLAAVKAVSTMRKNGTLPASPRW